MNIQDFELEYRNQMISTFDELQTAILLLAELQIKINQIGISVQGISHTVENFITEQKAD